MSQSYVLQRPTVSTFLSSKISKENQSISTDGSFTNNATEGMNYIQTQPLYYEVNLHESHVWGHRSVIKIGTLTAAAIR